MCSFKMARAGSRAFCNKSFSIHHPSNSQSAFVFLFLFCLHDFRFCFQKRWGMVVHFFAWKSLSFAQSFHRSPLGSFWQVEWKLRPSLGVCFCYSPMKAARRHPGLGSCSLCPHCTSLCRAFEGHPIYFQPWGPGLYSEIT